MDRRDSRPPAYVRGYDSNELFRQDLWLRRIADSRQKFATMELSMSAAARGGSSQRRSHCFRKEAQRGTGASQEKVKGLEIEDTLDRALKFADFIASGEALSCLTVDEVTKELRGLLHKLDAETQKELMERIWSVL